MLRGCTVVMIVGVFVFSILWACVSIQAMNSEFDNDLLRAVINGDKSCVEQAFSRGVSPLIERNGVSLFAIAVSTNRDEIVALCVEHINRGSGNCLSRRYTIDINKPLTTGLTPLEMAIMFGHFNTVRELVCNSGRAVGIDINHLGSDGSRPVHWAASLVLPSASDSVLEIIEILRSAGADFTQLTRDGRSALQVAENIPGQDPRVVNKIKKIMATKDRTGCKFLCWFLCWFALWYSGILELSRA